jgi:hypothetical protein
LKSIAGQKRLLPAGRIKEIFMNVTQLRRVRRLFNNPDVAVSTNRHNQAAWTRSVRFLGDKWLLAVPVQKVQK